MQMADHRKAIWPTLIEDALQGMRQRGRGQGGEQDVIGGPLLARLTARVEPPEHGGGAQDMLIGSPCQNLRGLLGSPVGVTRDRVRDLYVRRCWPDGNRHSSGTPDPNTGSSSEALELSPDSSFNWPWNICCAFWPADWRFRFLRCWATCYGPRAGLFGAAPSVALATLALAFAQHGFDYVATEARSMAIGAIAFALFSVTTCQLLMRLQWRAWTASSTAVLVWLGASFGLLQLMLG
jgi:hypothetical protein